MSPIIQPEELLKIYQHENVVLVDAGSGGPAIENYNHKHLKGALYVDLNDQLSDIKEDAAIGGRHPLPSISQFNKVLTDLGVAADSHVIIYDDKKGANASARFWWMLKSVGHEKVQVLSGGLQAAAQAGIPTSSEKETPKENTAYKATEWQLPLVGISEVEKVSKSPDYLVVDVREEDRYNGLTEPIDLIAGHIPGAVNIPLSQNLNSDGSFKSPEALKKQYTEVIGNRNSENIIIHCGSGVTACHTILAMAYAGMEIPNLYVGSWSEWSRNNKEMITAAK
ncbi:sulfurtransferase [Limibacter armeniacum]|uniref:sulfurtransferase n=1 Tax=Limibacter armeniacum TaxID=466084 RepID=UPI002FE524C8